MKVILDYLQDLYENEILHDRKYGVRVEIKDGYSNSYIGFNVDVSSYNKSNKPKSSSLRLYRHTNDSNNLVNTWGFSWGGIVHPICDNADMPLEFSSYGKSLEESISEASKYFEKIKNEIKKVTAKIKIEDAETVESEIAQLKKRLLELEDS